MNVNIHVMALEMTAIYAGILAVLYIIISLRVSLGRKKNKVNLGDGGNEDMQKRIRVHGNFAEYVPMALLLMAIVEINGGVGWAIHVLGIALVVGRLLHAYGLSAGVLPGRAIGSLLSWLVIVAAGVYAFVQAVS